MAEFRTDFVAPDDTLLTVFVGEGGVTFAPHHHTGVFYILANRVTHRNGTIALYAASIAPDTADCFAEALLYIGSTANGRSGPALRISGVSGGAGSTAHFYALRWHGTSRAWQVVRVTGGGTPVVLGSAAFNVTVGARYLLRIEAEGSQITGYVDGMKVIEVVDTAVPGAGAVGITWDSGSTADAAGQHIEELAGGDLGAPPPAGVTVSPGAIASTARPFAPAVARSASTLRVSHIAAGSQAFAPTITEGTPASVVQLDRIPSSAELHAPTISPASASVQLLRIGAASRTYSPSITAGVPGASTVRVGAISTQARAFAPAVLRARSIVVVDLLEHRAVLFTPAIAEGDRAEAVVALPFLTSTAVALAPAARPGGVFVELEVIVRRSLVLPPALATRMIGYLTVDRVSLTPALAACARLEPALDARISLHPR